MEENKLEDQFIPRNQLVVINCYQDPMNPAHEWEPVFWIESAPFFGIGMCSRYFEVSGGIVRPVINKE